MMTFDSILQSTDRRFFQKKYFLRVLLLTFITAAISIVPFAMANGGIFSLRDDFDYQQIVFSMFANSSLKSGDTGWSWYTDLGSSFIGGYSFYNLGSPFLLLMSIFPACAVPYLIGVFIVLKYCVAGCLAYLYIGRFVKNQNYAVIGALLYAFSGFQTMNLLFPFHDVTAIFPLLLIGIEELGEKRRIGVFTLAVALCAVVNYYFLFGQIIFLIIYYIFRFLIPDFKKNIKTVPLCLLCGVLGIGIAAFFFLPSTVAVLDNPRLGSYVSQVVYDWQTYLMIMQAYFIPADVMGSQAYFINQSCDSCAIYLPLFAMTLVFAYIIENRKSTLSWMMIFFAGMSLVPVLNASFSMFNARYYARWYYMLTLIFALASAIALDRQQWSCGIANSDIKSTDVTIKRKNIIGRLGGQRAGFLLNFAGSLLTVIACIGVVTLSVLMQLHIEDKVNIKMAAFYGVLTFVGIVVSMFCLRVRDTKRKIAAIMCGVIAFSVLTSSLAVYRYKKGSDSGYWYNDEILSVSKPIEGKKLYNSLVDIADEIELPDDQDYRIRTAWYDKDDNYVWHSYDNLSMLIKIPSVNNFNSTVNGGVFEFYDGLGIERSVTALDNTHAGLSELLSCRYYFTSVKEPSKETVSQYTDSVGDTVYVYEYENFIPIGFTYKYYISEEIFENYSTSEKSLILLNAVVLSEEEISEVNGVLAEIPQDVLNEISEEFVSDYASERKNESSYEFKRDSYSFTSKIKCDSDTYAYFSVPYDRGWSATVNGRNVDIINTNGMMIVPVEAGDNFIEFEYTIPGFKTGIVISVISFTAFVLLWVMSKRKNTFSS